MPQSPWSERGEFLAKAAMRIMKFTLPFIVLALLPHCASQSILLPADTLKKGQKEAFFGRSLQSGARVDFIGAFGYGLNEHADIYALFSGSALTAMGRWSFFNSTQYWLSLSAFGGIGRGFLEANSALTGDLINERRISDHINMGGTLGKKIGGWEPSFSYKWMFTPIP